MRMHAWGYIITLFTDGLRETGDDINLRESKAIQLTLINYFSRGSFHIINQCHQYLLNAVGRVMLQGNVNIINFLKFIHVV